MGEPKVCFLTNRYNMAVDLFLDAGFSSPVLEKMEDAPDKYWCADECGDVLVDLKSNPGSRCNGEVDCCVLNNGRAYQAVSKKSSQLPDSAKMILNGNIGDRTDVDRMLLASLVELYDCLKEDSMACVSRIITETETKKEQLEKKETEKKRAEEEKLAAERLAKEMKKYKDEAAKAWKTANDILAWATEEDCGPGGITPKYIQKIIAKYIYLEDADPETVEEAKRYAELSRAMLAEIATDDSGLDAIKAEGFGLRTCHTKDSDRIECDRGYEIRNEIECTLVSGFTYEDTTYDNHDCYNKPPDKPEKIGIGSELREARERAKAGK